MKIKIDKSNMSLYSAVKNYKNSCRLHMPGHKDSNLIKKYFGKPLLDITELPFSDNLLSADGIIKKAENKFADCYNAKAVKFSSCGSTIGILSIIHSLKGCGSSLIIERNSHKSVYSALKISNIEPIIVNNNLAQNNLYGQICASDVKKALVENQDSIGALVTSPDYFGFCADLKQIAKILHDKGKLLIVDASHGGHLPYYYKDIFKYADVYICSAHKTLPALTPSSITLFNNDTLLKSYLNSFNIFHSTSPSYRVLASIDFAREYMQKNGTEKLKILKNLYQKYTQLLNKIDFEVIQNDDFTKLIIGKKGCSGYDIYNHLVKKGLYCELANDNYVLALFSVADKEKSYKKLYNALKTYICDIVPKTNIVLPPSLQRGMSYLQASSNLKEQIPLDIAEGRIAASDAGLYPPSYPLVCCGDILSKEMCKYLADKKGHTFGLDNNSIYVVK